MERIKYGKTLKIILFLFCIFSIFTLEVFADEREIKIEDLRTNLKLEEDGSYFIEENLTYDFNGKFNGAFKDISYRGLGSIDDLKVNIVESDGRVVPLSRDENAQNGDSYVYSIKKMDEDMIRVKIFIPTKDKKRTLKITYKSPKGATLYEDTGEMSIGVWDSGYETKVKNLSATITFPKAFEQSKLNVYPRGSKYIEYNFVDNKTIEIKDKNISGNYVQCRVLFPKELLVSCIKKINEPGKEKFIKEEEKYKKKMEMEKVRIAKLGKTFNDIGKVSIGVGVFLTILFILCTKKDKRSLNLNGIPEDITPAVVNRIFNSIDNSKSFIATILDLNRKGYLSIESFTKNRKENYKISITNKSQGYSNYDDYVSKEQGYISTEDHFKKYNDSYENYNSSEELLEHEVYFLDMLNKYSDYTGILSMREFRNKIKKPSNRFYEDLNIWNRLIKKEVKYRNIIDRSKWPLGIIYIVASIIILSLSIFQIIYSGPMGVINILNSIFILILGICLFNVLTPYGYTEKKKWINLKNIFMRKDFSAVVNGYPVDNYFPYMVSLGVAENTLASFRKFIVNNSVYNDDNWIMNYFLVDHMIRRNSFLIWGGSNFNNYTFYAGNNNSSGGGYTGGFSGGNGGASGGGGAGGF